MAKQVMDIRAGKGFTKAQSAEHLRIPNKEGKAYAESRGNNYDPYREKLNFEVTKGGVISAVDKTKSIPKRIQENLASRGIKDPNEGLSEPKFRTVVNIIYGGSTERMREMAFGNQQVDYEKKSLNNSLVERQKAIEDWARDVYNWTAKKFGEENIAAFVVHLDESNPHIHCTLLPIQDGKFSFKKIFAGKDKFEYSAKMKELHSSIAKEVNEKYGLVRGEAIAETGARHRSTEEYRRQLTGELSEKERQKETLDRQIYQANKGIKSLTTMIRNINERLQEKQKQIETLDLLLKDKVGDPNLAEEKIKALEELKKIEDELNEKKGTLAQLNQRLEALTSLKKDREIELQNVEHQLATDPERVEFAKDKIRQALVDEMGMDVVELMEKRPEAKEELDGTFLKEVAENGPELMQQSLNLFLGILSDVNTFAQVSGGGRSYNNGRWGRRKDDDDALWGRRCVNMAKRFLHSKKVGLKLKR